MIHIHTDKAHEFLTSGRIAIVGASDDEKNFGGYVHRELADHGIEVVAVNPGHETVAGRPCYPSVTEVPGDIEGVLVMVSGAPVLDVIRAAAERGVPRVWLFKGLGGQGAATADAIALCEQLGLEVVPGACPLMFLAPVHGAHRVHRLFRRLNHSVDAAA